MPDNPNPSPPASDDAGRWLPTARLMGLSAVAGLGAGLAAVAFQALAGLIVHFGLYRLAGYDAGGPAYEMILFGQNGPAAAVSPWLILAVITAGGLLSGLLVYTFAPETEGHGTDAAIRVFHRGRGIIRPRVPLVKLLASAITIGTGGSGGREGPIAQIGAGLGSLLGVRLGLPERERRILLAVGLGAGVAAIFRAPLAGAVFATEVLYSDGDLEAEALMPGFIGCTVAYVVFALAGRWVLGTGHGFVPLFTTAAGLRFNQPLLLAPLALLALAMAAASLLYVKCFYGAMALFQRLPLKKHLRPAVGALATGLVAVAAWLALGSAAPEARHDTLSVLSFGYGFLQKVLGGDLPYGTGTALAVLAVVGFGKILTTSLTIGSGGSGGVFGPSMVIGGALGAAVAVLLNAIVPGANLSLSMFAVLGMAAFFTAAAKTPISTLIIVAELTAGYELFLPAMWVCALAYLASRPWTIYREQVPTRLHSPAHRFDFTLGP